MSGSTQLKYVERTDWEFGRGSRRNEWSSADLRRLRELAAEGHSPESIATLLRRTASAIRNKAGMQGISLKARR